MLDPKPPPPDRSGERIRGKYKLDARIAVGGMGEVYRATNTLVGREVAIKMLLPHLARSENVRARFLREAQLAHFVRHAHVVEIFDIDEDDGGVPFIVQELLEGEDLASYLDRAGAALSIDETLAVMVPVADALAAAHLKGLVHRDLKPENIYLAAVNGAQVPKILDFGISKVTKSGAQSPDADGRTIVGSPAYMSPEQIRTPGDVDQRTDVWAVGVILYECLTGRSPFDAASVQELFVKICRDDPPPIDDLLPDVPHPLRDLVMACLDRRSDHRPKDGAALARELHRVSSRQVGGQRDSRPSIPPPKRVGVHKRSERPGPGHPIDRTAPDLSEYGAFQVPQELLLDFGDLGALDSPASIASAVAHVTAGRRSVSGALQRDRTPTPSGHMDTSDLAPLDIDPRDLAPRHGRRSYAGSPSSTTSPQPEPASVRQRTPERATAAAKGRLPDVPTVGVLLSAGAWVLIAGVSVFTFGRAALPPALSVLGAAVGFVVLAVVLVLGATAIGVVMRARNSPGYTLGLVGVGGVGAAVTTTVLGLRHLLPNLPAIRESHEFFGVAGIASVALLALGLGLRGVLAGLDALRLRSQHVLMGVVVMGLSIVLLGAGGLAVYALGVGKLTIPESHSPNLGEGPRPPESE